MKKKIGRLTIWGVLAICAGFVALVVCQVCLIESFWLRVIVAPLSPQAAFRPNWFTYAGGVCLALVAVLTLLGGGLLLRAMWLFLSKRSGQTNL